MATTKTKRRTGKGKPKRPGLRGKAAMERQLAEREPTDPEIRDFQRLSQRLIEGLEVLDTVFENLAVTRNGQASARPAIPFEQYAEDLDLITCMIDDRGMTDVEGFDASDLAVFISNKGSAADRAEALLAIVPVARRLYDRITQDDE